MTVKIFIRYLFSCILFCCLFKGVLAQDSTYVPAEATPPVPPPFLKYMPEISLGVGHLLFKGDIGYEGMKHPIKFRMGYNFALSKEMLPSLKAHAFILKGNLYGNKKSIAENLNFHAKMFSAGVGIRYEFEKLIDQFLFPKPFISPYLTLGVATVSHTTKLDLKDANGNPYYYWSDGSIRNLPEAGINYTIADLVPRDYTYETAAQGPASTLSFPIGLGIKYGIMNRLYMNLGTTLFMTGTDLMDNIKDKGNDKFFYTSFSLTYNISAPRFVSDENKPYEHIDFKSIDAADSDNDKVRDKEDECPGTPADVAVDAKGCPLDSDKDGIPDYRDKQPDSPAGAIVDELGIELTDEYIAQKLAEQQRLDSLEGLRPRAKDPTPTVSMGWVMNPDAQTIYTSSSAPRAELVYKVYLGAHPDSIPPELIEKFLTVEDISSKKNSEGLNEYTAGSYSSKEDAAKRKEDLVAKGLAEAQVQAYDKEGNKVDDSAINAATSSTTREPVKSTIPAASSNEITYRVQLGAFSNTISPDEFKDVPETYTEPGPNGLTRYITGNFKSYGEAAAFRDQAKTNRKDGAYVTAFVVAYKGSERVNLSEVIPAMGLIEKNRKVISYSLQKAEDELVTFKVQIGVFKNDVPSDHLGIFLSLKKVERETTEDGLTRYTAGGSFTDYNAADAYKNEIADKGVSDAFVIGYIGKKQVSAAEAVEFLNKQ